MKIMLYERVRIGPDITLTFAVPAKEIPEELVSKFKEDFQARLCHWGFGSVYLIDKEYCLPSMLDQEEHWRRLTEEIENWIKEKTTRLYKILRLIWNPQVEQYPIITFRTQDMLIEARRLPESFIHAVFELKTPAIIINNKNEIVGVAEYEGERSCQE